MRLLISISGITVMFKKGISGYQALLALFSSFLTLFQCHDHSVQQVNHRETKADQQLSSLTVSAIELYSFPVCSQH